MHCYRCHHSCCYLIFVRNLWLQYEKFVATWPQGFTLLLAMFVTSDCYKCACVCLSVCMLSAYQHQTNSIFNFSIPTFSIPKTKLFSEESCKPSDLPADFYLSDVTICLNFQICHINVYLGSVLGWIIQKGNKTDTNVFKILCQVCIVHMDFTTDKISAHPSFAVVLIMCTN